jgi:hypothetical protein
MVWPHAQVDRLGAWEDFGPVVRATEALELSRPGWRDVGSEVTVSARTTEQVQVVTEVAAYGDVPSWGVKAPRASFTVDVSTANQWLEEFCPTLYGNSPARQPWRNPPELRIEMPSAGRLLLDVQEIGGGTQRLTASIDGVEAVEIELTGGRRTLGPDERWVSVPLGAGVQVVRLDNEGGDWIRLRRLYVIREPDRAGEGLTVRGQSLGAQGIVALFNPTHSPVYRDVLGREPVPFEQVDVRIPHVPDGRYRVETIEVDEPGAARRESREAREGTLSCRVRRVEAGVVILFRRQP